MRILLIGSPGAGKGTQAEKLAGKLKIPRLTTGDLLRQTVQAGTPLGNRVRDILERGALVSDDVVLELMQERMSQPDAESGFILDGFPRTLGQAKGLEEWLKKKNLELTAAIALDISEEEAVLRITGRRQCERCGAAVHVTTQPPKKENVCDSCGGALGSRKDDAEPTVRHRLKVYRKETAPLLKYYEDQGLLQNLDGSQNVEKVFDAVCSLIK